MVELPRPAPGQGHPAGMQCKLWELLLLLIFRTLSLRGFCWRCGRSITFELNQVLRRHDFDTMLGSHILNILMEFIVDGSR